MKEALNKYDGEKSDEAVFNAVLAPIAKEYGIEATFDDYKNYSSSRELSEDELAQVSGGTFKQGTSCTTAGGIDPDYCQFGISPLLTKTLNNN